MEFIPTINEKVIYPKGCKVSGRTIFNAKVYKFAKQLHYRLPNEFKHCLKAYNPYNSYDNDKRFPCFLDDYNNYNIF